jgi:hypothetical protein
MTSKRRNNMSEKINFNELRKSEQYGGMNNIKWSILTVISRSGCVDAILENKPHDDNDDLLLDVELTINGVEVKFSHLIDRLFEEYTDSLQRSVKRGVSNALSDKQAEAIQRIEAATEYFIDKLDLPSGWEEDE